MSSSGERVSAGAEAASAAGGPEASGAAGAGAEAPDEDEEAAPSGAAAGALAGSSEQAASAAQARKAIPMKPDRIRTNPVSLSRSPRREGRGAAGEYPPESRPTNSRRAPAGGRFSRRRRHARFAALALAALGLSLLGLGIGAPSGRAATTPREPLDLARYARLLAQHTRPVDSLAGTAVDYAALARSKDLPVLVAQIAAARPSRLGHKDRLAFWINAYNLLTLELVARHLPIESIEDIGSFLSPVWRMKRVEVEGVAISLDHIEHEILRPEGEPRIHAALVCASKSCPPLLRRPYRGATLDADLDEAMRRWLASRRKGVAIDRAKPVLRVSKIFDWYAEDFAAGGGVRGTIARYLPAADATWLRGPGRQAPIEYFDYDWTLNDR